MTVAEQIEEVRQKVAAARRQGARIGLVPTMGALHAGHVSLMQAARRECDYVVVSIFVNPTQFGPHEDLQKYPRPLAADLKACEAEDVDLVFHPQPETIYPDAFRTFVEVQGLSDVLEGKFRPGHFRGVATVVLKLFNIVAPDIAYFGQKDYQQQTLIRRMCRDLDLPVEIRVCPTIREADGLALSSRNVYLSPEERQAALSLSRCLRRADELLRRGAADLEAIRGEMRQVLTDTPGVVPDYATLVDPETLTEATAVQPRLVALVAARVGRTRLIDNLPIDRPGEN
jgi:pantoate--beta-alanine ligase